LFNFERAFEIIRKNNKDCKKTLRKFNLRKPRRETCMSEQVGLILIFDSKEKWEEDDLQQ
jgi:hypothetical protein